MLVKTFRSANVSESIVSDAFIGEVPLHMNIFKSRKRVYLLDL